MSQLNGKKVLMFVDDVYEDLELWYPRLRLIETGAQVVVAGPERGAKYEGKNGYPCRSDAAISDMNHADFDALVIPGVFAVHNGWLDAVITCRMPRQKSGRSSGRRLVT